MIEYCKYCGKVIYKNKYKYDENYCCISHRMKHSGSMHHNPPINFSQLDDLTPLEALHECSNAIYNNGVKHYKMFEFEKDNCFNKIIQKKSVINRFIKDTYALKILDKRRFNILLSILKDDKEKLQILMDNIDYTQIEEFIKDVENDFVQSLCTMKKLS